MDFESILQKTLHSDIHHLDLSGYIDRKELHASAVGGSCDVYTAWSIKHNKKVAVKQIRALLRNDLALAKVSGTSF